MKERTCTVVTYVSIVVIVFFLSCAFVNGFKRRVFNSFLIST